MSKFREQARAMMDKSKGRDTTLRSPSGIFNTYYTLPDDLSTWFAKSSDKGIEHYIDIVPFPYGPNFPNEVWAKPWGPGTLPYTLIVDIHKGIGPENAWVVCPKNNYAERCPVCEDMSKLQKEEPDPDKRKAIWTALRTYRRQFLYVIVRDGGEEEEKGLQFWEVPVPYMQDKLDAIRHQGRSGEAIDYWDFDFGKTVKFRVKNKGDYPDFDGHAFDDRVDPSTKKKYVIEDEFIEKAMAFPLDQALKRLTYDEVSEIYYAEAGKKPAKTVVEDEEEAQPTRGRRTRATVEPEPVVEDTEPEEPQVKEEPPATSRRERSRRERAAPANECPFGHEFGADCLDTKDCDECPDKTYRACEDKKAELEKENTKPRRGRK